MTEPHSHKSWPQSTGSCQCEVPFQISAFLWFPGCRFTPPKINKVCSAGSGLSYWLNQKLQGFFENIVGLGCSTDILGGQTTPTGSGLPRSSLHANKAGLQESSYIHCFKLLQGVPGSENEAERLQMLGRARSQRKYSLRCLQQTMRKVGNALKAAQPMQKSLELDRGFQSTTPSFKSRNTRVKLLAG